MIRLIKELEELDDNEVITLEEVSRLLKAPSYNWIRYIIRKSKQDMRKSKWDIDLNKFILKYPRRYRNCYCIHKKDLHYFKEYSDFRINLQQVRKNKLAYRKRMKECYGLEGIYTSECSKNDFNCDRCINQSDCKMYNAQVNVKKLAKMIDVLFKEKSSFSYTLELEKKINELENVKCEEL